MQTPTHKNLFKKIEGGIIKITKMNIGSVSHFSHRFDAIGKLIPQFSLSSN